MFLRFLFFCLLSLTLPVFAEAGPLAVVATIGPLADLVKEVGGGEVKVTTLLRAGNDPHTFEPSPREMRSIVAADLVVMVGFGFDRWVARMSQTGEGERVALTGSDTIKQPLGYGNRHRHEEGRDVSPFANPHYWLDPNGMKPLARAIANSLITLRPAKKELFEKRVAKLLNRLDSLGAEIDTLFERIGGERRFVAFHDSFSYFARRFGLTTRGLIQSAPGREPSAKEFAHLITLMRRERLRVVVTERGHGALLAKALAAEVNATVVLVDPLGGSGGPTDYFDLIRWNADQFINGFQKKQGVTSRAIARGISRE